MLASDKDELCAICKEDSPNFITDCNHNYHAECLFSWLKKSKSCPLCMKDQEMDDLIFKAMHSRIENIGSWDQYISAENIELLIEVSFNQNNVDILFNLLALETKVDKNELLISSVESRNIEYVKILLENGADVNSLGSEDQSALFLACENGCIEIVELLLKDPAINMSYSDTFSPSALFAATKGLYVEIVKLLLQKSNADISLVDPETGLTPLHFAFSIENNLLIDLFIANGADCLRLTDKKDSILDLALSTKNLALIMKTYEICPRIQRNTVSKAKALKISFELNSLPLLKRLLSSGVSFDDYPTEDGKTVLIYACELGCTEIVEYLLNFHEDTLIEIDSLDDFDMTALHYACEAGRYEIFEIILNNSANVNIQNSEEMIPLMLAITKGHSEIALKLIESRSNLCIQNENGKNSLELAIEAESIEIVEKMLKGSNIKALMVEKALYKICSSDKYLNFLDLFIENGLLDKYDFGMKLFNKAVSFDVVKKLCDVETRKRSTKLIQ